MIRRGFFIVIILMMVSSPAFSFVQTTSYSAYSTYIRYQYLGDWYSTVFGNDVHCELTDNGCYLSWDNSNNVMFLPDGGTYSDRDCLSNQQPSGGYIAYLTFGQGGEYRHYVRTGEDFVTCVPLDPYTPVTGLTEKGIKSGGGGVNGNGIRIKGRGGYEKKN